MKLNVVVGCVNDQYTEKLGGWAVILQNSPSAISAGYSALVIVRAHTRDAADEMISWLRTMKRKGVERLLRRCGRFI